MELVQIYFKKFNKVEVISHFLAFVQFLVDNFTLLDPDPAGKMNAYPCGSGSMRIWINADPCPCGIGYTALHQFLHSVCINIVIRGKLTTRASVLRIRIGSDPNLFFRIRIQSNCRNFDPVPDLDLVPDLDPTLKRHNT